MINTVYDYPLYRPPSEAHSLILQITLGCSHNKCTFCNMYREKKFRIKALEQIKNEIDFFRKESRYVRRIFLADGDALIVKTSILLEILRYINEKFPENERIALYASSRSLMLKTSEELKKLKEYGVELIYIGLESGDDEVLTKINKGSTVSDFIAGLKKAKEAGFKISVTVIAGLAGKNKNSSINHALKTAQVIQSTLPDFLGVLCLNLLPNTILKEQAEKGEFDECEGFEMIEEIKLILENLNISEEKFIVFRSNHISNYLNLQGTLPKDREKLLKDVNYALENNFMIDRIDRKTL